MVVILIAVLAVMIACTGFTWMLLAAAASRERKFTAARDADRDDDRRARDQPSESVRRAL